MHPVRPTNVVLPMHTLGLHAHSFNVADSMQPETAQMQWWAVPSINRFRRHGLDSSIRTVHAEITRGIYRNG